MKRWILIAAGLVLFSAAFAQDTIPQPDDEMNLFLLVLGIGFIAVLFVGGLVCIAVCGGLVLLTIGGILSFSVMMGFYRRSVKTGFRWAIFLLFALGGAAAGIVSYFIFRIIRHLQIHISTPILISAAAGLAGGLICAWLFLTLLRRGVNYLQKRLQLSGDR